MRLFEAGLASVVVAFAASYSHADEFSARLSGFNEIGSIPTSVTVSALNTTSPTSYTRAILTDATDTLHLDLDKKKGTLAHTLTYTGPFTSDVQQAHIHVGKSRDSGGIVVWLCQTTMMLAPAQVAALTPTCPTPNSTATVTGNITTDNVLAVAGQNVTAKQLDAITSHTAYANIHTANFPKGEIRGQIRSEDRGDQNGQHDRRH